MVKRVLLIIMVLALSFTSFTSCKNEEEEIAGGQGDKVVAVPGGTLKLACVSVDTMNPLATQHASVYDFLSLIYEGLFVVKPDLTVEPVLAENYEVSENNTVYTIKLKDNIRFHNGKIFTADDVVATLEYMAFYTTRWQSFTQYLAGYYAEDHTTLVIKLNSCKADFINNLDFPILPSGLGADAFMSPNQAFVPVGTGVYEYDTTVAYKDIILKANDDWHGGTDKAYIENVDVEILSDEETLISAFDAGSVDALTTSWKSFGELGLTSSLFNTFENEQNQFTFVGINCKSMYFDTAKERRALRDGINSKKIADDIMLGHAVVAHSPIRENVYFNSKIETSSEDPVKSERSAEGEPIECRLLYNSDSKTKSRIAAAVKQQLESRGYSIFLDGQPLVLYNEKVSVGDYELYIGEVKMTGSCDLSFMFSSPYLGICNYDDGELRSLVSNLDLVDDTEDKKVAWSNFKKYYKGTVPQVPLYFTNGASFVNKRIKGSLKPNLSTPYYGIDDMFINYEKQ